MYRLKKLSIIHNDILHRFFLILQIACVVLFLSFPLSYANEHGATVLTVPVTTENFPNDPKDLATLLHQKTGLQEPRVYKNIAPKYCKNAMQLTPRWLKIHCGTSPLFSVRKESATQVQLLQYTLSQAIELIESDECQDDVSFVSVLDKKIAHTLKKCNQLSSLSFQGTRKSSINILEHEPLLCPLNYEEKNVPITLFISFNRWQKIFKYHATSEEMERQLSCMHKKFQSTFDNTFLTLPNHITFLEVSNKHHVEHLHQNTIHVSNIIVQIHGQQKVVLMPPISEQHPYHHLLDSTGQFIFNKEIDLSTSNSILNNELRLAHTTLYSTHLNPGDLLLVPANWFLYRKSLETSVSLSLNYLFDDKWRFFYSQAEPMKQKHEHEHEYITQNNDTIQTWAHMEIQKHPHNAHNILHACKKIRKAISDATQQVLDLQCLYLNSLPKTIFFILHLHTLNLSENELTSFSLSHMNNLVSLDVSSNALTSFSLSHMKNLVSLNLTCNHLLSFSLRHVENLTSLDLSYNELPCFFLRHIPKLTSLNLSSNALTFFSLSHTPELTSLELSYNILTFFFLSDMPKLDLLVLSSNQLISFFLSNMNNLVSLNASCNQLISFSLSHVENLASLDLSSNDFTSFSLSHVKNLVSLNLAYNQLTSFSLSHIPKLTSLYLSNNKLNRFLSRDLPNVKHLDLSYNSLSHLGENGISSLNNDQRITLNLQDNPWSDEGITQIQSDLSQRSGDNTTHYPIWVADQHRRLLFIEKIQQNAMKYQDFLHLLSHYNMFPSPNNPHLQCYITLTAPSHIICFMTSNKCYIIYDADALVRWINTRWQQMTSLSRLMEEMIVDPTTRESITLHNLISAKQPHVLQYLQKKLGPDFTENIGLIHDPNYFISFFTQHLNELNEKLNNVIKDLIPIQTTINAIKNRLHECLNAHDFAECAQTFLIRDENCAVHMFAQQEDNNVTVILNFLKCSQENITNCALPLLQTENFHINTGPIDIASQSTMDGQTLREKRNQLFIKQLSLLTPPYSKERSRSICTSVMPIMPADFPSGSCESIPWTKNVSEIPKQDLFSALIRTTQPTIKYLEFMQQLLEQKIKISCDRLHKTTTKYPIDVENDQGALLFQKIHDMLYAKDASKHYLVEMYMTGVKIVLFMQNMKENIDHILYRLQAYRSGTEDIAHQQKMFDAAQKLEHHFERQHQAIKEKSTLFMTPLFDESCAILHDNIHWTQEELNEQLKNFIRITWVD